MTFLRTSLRSIGGSGAAFQVPVGSIGYGLMVSRRVYEQKEQRSDVN